MAGHVGGGGEPSSSSSTHRQQQHANDEGTVGGGGGGGGGGRWYMSRKEIEENSPSRRDGIDLKKESFLRKAYCTYLQDLGIRLKVPQVTIATAIIFCHRFFLRQSLAKNDRRTIATVCMFLAGKVEETPRPLKDVIVVSYEIIHKKDPAAAQRIKQKEVYEQQKELILMGERVVLATLGFDLNVHHPYKPLVEAIKKFRVAQNALAQVAWNFVNDGLRTSLCLQFKPHHIAAGAIFLAAKFLKVKLPSDGEKVWWQEFDVIPRQLEEVSNQMLELYEQNRVPPSQGSEVDGSGGGGSASRSSKLPATNEEQSSRQVSSRIAAEGVSDGNGTQPRPHNSQSFDHGAHDGNSVITEHKVDVEAKDSQHIAQLPVRERHKPENQERNGKRSDVTEEGEWLDTTSRKPGNSLVVRNLELREGSLGQSPKEAIKIDKDKVKAALEKRRKERAEMTKKNDLMDEDDLIERELEDGVELAAEDEKLKNEKRQSWPKIDDSEDHGDARQQIGKKGQTWRRVEGEHYAEEGEMLEDASPLQNSRKRKGSPVDRQMEGKKRHEYAGSGNNREFGDDGHRTGRAGHSEKEHRRHSQDNGHTTEREHRRNPLENRS
ncbi:hypothetical protein MLD38_021245 [Melastoma candidum]|uniref:Uncharacterized protein n=2 Tax=Melastoma candidum TaxID=119954 RepID=A0ACB9QFI1_9MYRT|nr:hypothetical protein MLD38_021245 [Melastoma candidum]